ncbi:hypothetical protein [Taibaiella koreensis]|uniref:hypothetical protein n=1 Tax=Taibaiella koreensis TaxID=1268548 RepID=UPI0013C36723|nr:hypothetical protein [Taibaiella koreensis]
MRRLLLIVLLSLPFFTYAQKNAEKKDAGKNNKSGKLAPKVNWGDILSRDYVCILDSRPNVMFKVNSLSPEWVVRVRFYGKGMSSLINIPRDAGQSLPFSTTGKDSRIVDVVAQSDGGIGVILATSDRLGPFIETVMIGGFYSYTFSIQGLVQTNDTTTVKK